MDVQFIVFISYPRESFRGDYGITGIRLSVRLSVCLFVCYYDNQIKRGQIWTKFLGKVPRGKASPSSFAVAIASRVWRLLTKNAVNRRFFQCEQTDAALPISCLKHYIFSVCPSVHVCLGRETFSNQLVMDF